MTDIITVSNLSKKFQILHEKNDSIYEIIGSVFHKKNSYEDLQVLNNISFTVKTGETFGIIGNNGCGKTTLLRLISRIYKPDQGNIAVNGTLVPFLGLGTGFEIDLTARTNIIQYGIFLGMSKKEIHDKIDDILAFAELEKFGDTKLKHFSSGMYARLAFSTAIQVNPDILIIDEILQVGDISFQQKCFDVISSFKRRGKAVIFVTHDMSQILQNCDRAMWINDGKIAKIDEPAPVVKAYHEFLFPPENTKS